MPYTGYSTNDGSLGCGSKLSGGSRQVCRKSGVLHSDFYGNSFTFGIVHSGNASGKITEEISEAVMKQYCGKDNHS